MEKAKEQEQTALAEVTNEAAPDVDEARLRELVERVVAERLADARLEGYREGLNAKISSLVSGLPKAVAELGERGEVGEVGEVGVDEDTRLVPHYERRSIWD